MIPRGNDRGNRLDPVRLQAAAAPLNLAGRLTTVHFPVLGHVPERVDVRSGDGHSAP